MKKLLILAGIFILGLGAFASDADAVKQFFNSHVEAGNSYNATFFDYYDSNPVITRVVIKKDGSTKTVSLPLAEYKKQSKLSSKLGKMTRYKNSYSNIQVVPEGDNYRLTAMRKPSTSSYSLPASFLIGKDASGNWKIKEESMQTKVQSFLKHHKT